MQPFNIKRATKFEFFFLLLVCHQSQDYFELLLKNSEINLQVLAKENVFWLPYQFFLTSGLKTDMANVTNFKESKLKTLHLIYVYTN